MVPLPLHKGGLLLCANRFLFCRSIVPSRMVKHKMSSAQAQASTSWRGISETRKIQVVDAGFFDGRYLCGAKRAGLDHEVVGGIDRRKLSKSKLTRVNPLSHGVPPCQLPLLMGASRLCANILFCIVQECLSDDKEKNEKRSLSLRQVKYNLLVEIHYPKGITV